MSFFACAAINRVDLALITNILEDTHLTLAAFLFKVEANNSLIFLPLQTYEKKIAKFPFLLVYNSLSPLTMFVGVVALRCQHQTLLCCVYNEVPQLPQT